MPKQCTFCFTKPTEMHGILVQRTWATPHMREAINMGTGPWFCILHDGVPKAAIEMSAVLVGIGFKYAYEFAKSEADAKTLAQAAFRYRKGTITRIELDDIHEQLRQKYARNFESRPLMVAARLASDNPCAVAAAVCVDAVKAPHQEIAESVLEYARKVIR